PNRSAPSSGDAGGLARDTVHDHLREGPGTIASPARGAREPRRAPAGTGHGQSRPGPARMVTSPHGPGTTVGAATPPLPHRNGAGHRVAGRAHSAVQPRGFRMSTYPHAARRFSALLARCAALAVALLFAQATAMAADPIAVADFRLPAQDAQGWSILQPAADSRLVYVDSRDGDDGSGRVYLPSDPEIGPEPQAPRGTVRAFRTLAAASAHTREDAPDWLLLRAGRVWNERLDLKRGRSPGERAVATAWGSGARPELRTGADKAIGNTSLVNVAVVGLRFWAHTRDTDGPYFTGHEGSSGISVFVRRQGDPRQVRDVLIEDCV